MVKNLPSWQLSLLLLSTLTRLKQLLDSGENLNFASSVMAEPKKTTDISGGNSLSEHGRPTFGFELGSFRAESHDMLSVLLFVELCFLFQVQVSDSIMEHLS
jgi:hypothetical protein